VTNASARRLSSCGRFVAAYILATVTVLAVHWALSPLLIPFAALAWLIVTWFGARSSWQEAGLILLTLPLGLVTDLLFVSNLQSCHAWVC
jgi:hypothetical protein